MPKVCRTFVGGNQPHDDPKTGFRIRIHESNEHSSGYMACIDVAGDDASWREVARLDALLLPEMAEAIDHAAVFVRRRPDLKRWLK